MDKKLTDRTKALPSRNPTPRTPPWWVVRWWVTPHNPMVPLTPTWRVNDGFKARRYEGK